MRLFPLSVLFERKPDLFQILLVIENVPNDDQPLQRDPEEIHIPRIGGEQMQIYARDQRPYEDRRANEKQGIRPSLPVAEPQYERRRRDAPDEQLPYIRLPGDLEINENGAEYEPDLTHEKDLRQDHPADVRRRDRSGFFALFLRDR